MKALFSHGWIRREPRRCGRRRIWLSAVSVWNCCIRYATCTADAFYRSWTVKPGQKLPEQWESFARELGIHLPPGRAEQFGDTLWWVPAGMPELDRLKVLRPGLELGQVKKDRFEPAHALALWLGKCSREVSFPPDSDAIRDYLHGQVLPCRQKGWCLVKAGEYSLGWGKGDGSQLKNHYPKGLRK